VHSASECVRRSHGAARHTPTQTRHITHLSGYRADSIHIATPDTTKQSCLCRVVNWLVGVSTTDRIDNAPEATASVATPSECHSRQPVFCLQSTMSPTLLRNNFQYLTGSNTFLESNTYTVHNTRSTAIPLRKEPPKGHAKKFPISCARDAISCARGRNFFACPFGGSVSTRAVNACNRQDASRCCCPGCS